MASATPLSPDEDLLWRWLARVTISLPRDLDTDLSRGAGLSLTEYGVLMNLSEAPDHQLRMTALSAATRMSASRITRLVEDLQRRGLVTRARCADDARGYLTTLSDTGIAQLKTAYPIHLASVRRRVFDRLDPTATAVLARALRSIAADDPRPP